MPKAEIIFTKEGRKGMVSSVKHEMQKAIDKENYLTEDERVLINKKGVLPLIIH